jgi:hypothetical protein
VTLSLLLKCSSHATSLEPCLILSVSIICSWLFVHRILGLCVCDGITPSASVYSNSWKLGKWFTQQNILVNYTDSWRIHTHTHTHTNFFFLTSDPCFEYSPLVWWLWFFSFG